MDPENKAAKNKVTICAHEIKSIKEKEKKTFANMFEKVTIYIFTIHTYELRSFTETRPKFCSLLKLMREKPRKL